MDKLSPKDEVPVGSAKMGNDQSRDFHFRHELGDAGADKPGQFHRVLVDPDYAVIEPPVLTKITVADQLLTLPETSTNVKPGTEVNGVDDTVTDNEAIDDRTADTDAPNNGAAICEDQIKIIAKELVDQVINNSLAKVSTETGAHSTVGVNGTLQVETETAPILPEENRETSDSHAITAIELSVNGETGNKEAREIEAVESPDDIIKKDDLETNSKVENDDIAQPDTGQLHLNGTISDELEPAVVKRKKDKSRNKFKKSKSKKAEKNLREREVIESVKKDLKESKLEDKKSEKGKGFLKMFKFSKRKPNVVADISTTDDGDNKPTDKADCILNGGQIEISETRVEVGHAAQDNYEKGSKTTDDTIDEVISGDGNINISKDTRSIDSGVVVDKVIEAKVDIDNVITVVENKIEDQDIKQTIFTDSNSIENVTNFANEDGQKKKDVAAGVAEQISDVLNSVTTTNIKDNGADVEKHGPHINAGVKIGGTESDQQIQEVTNTESEVKNNTVETFLKSLPAAGNLKLNGDLQNKTSAEMNQPQDQSFVEELIEKIPHNATTEVEIKQESTNVEEFKKDLTNTTLADVNLNHESAVMEELKEDVTANVPTEVNLTQDSTVVENVNLDLTNTVPTEELNKDITNNLSTEVNLKHETTVVTELTEDHPDTESTEVDLKQESNIVDELKKDLPDNVSTEVDLKQETAVVVDINSDKESRMPKLITGQEPEPNHELVSFKGDIVNDASTEVNLNADPVDCTVDPKDDVSVSVPVEVNLPSDPVGAEVEKKCDPINVETAAIKIQPEHGDGIAMKNELSNSISSDVHKADSSKADVNTEPNTSEIKSDLPLTNGNNLNEKEEDFSERGVDVEGLDASIQKIVIKKDIPETISKLTDGLENSRGEHSLEQDVVAKDTANANDLTDANIKPTVKIKKRSWSFQIGGNKKKVEGLEKDTEDTKSNTHPSADVRKPRWKLGKLSFRKSHTEVSASTPNLNEVGVIPEEGDSKVKREMKDSKSKSILKKIKAKKEKKRESQRREADSLERRSNSLMDIAIGDNRPGSRRSIVEEDVPYVQTDAFDGVDLADLSADEDATVSTNPSGSDVAKKSESKGNGLAARAKGFFKKKSSPTTIQPDSPEIKAAINGIKMVCDGEYAQISHKDMGDDTKVGEMEEETHAEAPAEAVEADVKPETVELTETVRETAGDVYAQIMKRDTKNEVKCENGDNDNIRKEAESDVEQKDTENRDTNINKSVDQSGESKEATNSNTGETVDASGVAGYSNPICGDGSFSFDVLKSVDGALKRDNEDTESDSYVQLDQMVSEFRPGNLSPKPPDIKPTTNSITVLKQGDDNHNGKTNDTEIATDNRDNPDENAELAITPVQSGNVYSETKSPVKAKSRVIIMKEVGVQAPDIHMPLDIERDFGFFSDDSPKASIGVQVSTGSMVLEIGDGVSRDSKDKKTSKCSINISPAYF